MHCLSDSRMFPRISPRGSPRTQLSSAAPTRAPSPPPVASTTPDQDLELEMLTSPPSVEETLAARRAKRQAIMAKYANVDLTNQASPSPGPSSAVQPPLDLPVVSDTTPQPHSATETPISPWADRKEENGGTGMSFSSRTSSRILMSDSQTRILVSFSYAGRLFLSQGR